MQGCNLFFELKFLEVKPLTLLPCEERSLKESEQFYHQGLGMGIRCCPAAGRNSNMLMWCQMLAI